MIKRASESERAEAGRDSVIELDEDDEGYAPVGREDAPMRHRGKLRRLLTRNTVSGFGVKRLADHNAALRDAGVRVRQVSFFRLRVDLPGIAT